MFQAVDKLTFSTTPRSVVACFRSLAVLVKLSVNLSALSFSSLVEVVASSFLPLTSFSSAAKVPALALAASCALTSLASVALAPALATPASSLIFSYSASCSGVSVLVSPIPCFLILSYSSSSFLSASVRESMLVVSVDRVPSWLSASVWEGGG